MGVFRDAADRLYAAVAAEDGNEVVFSFRDLEAGGKDVQDWRITLPVSGEYGRVEKVNLDLTHSLAGFKSALH